MKPHGIATATAALIFLIAVLVAGTSRAADEDMPLGRAHLFLKLDIIDFTDEVVEASGDLDQGGLVSVGAYLLASDNVYIGGELGYTSTDGDRDTRLKFLPIEFNIKYAAQIFPDTVVDIGGGLSAIYVEEESLTGPSSDIDDWVVGGQVFASVNRVFAGNFFIGIEGKYQITENFKTNQPSTATFDLTNWRLGARAGLYY